MSDFIPPEELAVRLHVALVGNVGQLYPGIKPTSFIIEPGLTQHTLHALINGESLTMELHLDRFVEEQVVKLVRFTVARIECLMRGEADPLEELSIHVKNADFVSLYSSGNGPEPDESVILSHRLIGRWLPHECKEIVDSISKEEVKVIENEEQLIAAFGMPQSNSDLAQALANVDYHKIETQVMGAFRDGTLGTTRPGTKDQAALRKDGPVDG